MVSNSSSASSFRPSLAYSSANAYRENESFGFSLRKPFKISMRFMCLPRMKDLRKDFHPVDQTGTGAVEVRGAIDCIDLAGPSRQELRAVVFLNGTIK